MKERYIFPGFIDAHCHFYRYALSLCRANLHNTNSFDEVLERLVEFKKQNQSEWILGRGWDQSIWKTTRISYKKKLDLLFPNNPVFLQRVDGHAVIVNSEALNRAGISKKTIIVGGKIEINNGEMTGVLIDNAAETVRKIIPVPSTSKIKTILKEAETRFLASGLTSICDAGLQASTIEIIDEMHKTNELKIRLYAILEDISNNIEEFIRKGKYKTNRLNVRSIKLFIDGAMGSRGAYLLKPYNDDPDNSGIMVKDYEYLKKKCELAADKDFQVCAHAIGDAAVRLVLNVYGEFLSHKNDKRWRIEHSQLVHPDDFSLFGKYNIIPSVQTSHLLFDMAWIKDRIGTERLKYAYAYKYLLNQNGWLVNGSDFPFGELDPLLGFYAAISRKGFNEKLEQSMQHDQTLTRVEAIKAMTIWAAKSFFEENEKGSIEAGKYADFVVLDKDLMKINENEIQNIKICSTYIAGKEVYSN